MPKDTSPLSRGPGCPDGPDDVINQYGTYEIQPTADAENRYPMIAQGLSQLERSRYENNRRAQEIKKREEGR